MIKGSFPISKVLVFEGNSYVCWKNEDIRLFYDCKECGNRMWKMKILDFYDCTMWLKALFLFFSFRG